MQPAAVASLALLLLARGAWATLSYDLTGGTPYYLNEAGTVDLVGGRLGGRPVMCYRDFGNLAEQASLTCTLVGTTSAGGSVVVSSLSSLHVSFAQLDDITAVVCYAAEARNKGKATCNVVALDGETITAGPDLVVDQVSTYVEMTTVAGLSSTSAVMCYRTKDLDINGVLRCVSLARAGIELGNDASVEVNEAFTFGASVVGFSNKLAMVCFSDDQRNEVGKELDQGWCSILAIGAGSISLTEAGWLSLQPQTLTKHVVARSLSDSTALVCFSEGDTTRPASDNSPGVAGGCLSVEVSASAITQNAALSITDGAISSLALQVFSDETAVLCYLAGESTDSKEGAGTCVEMVVSGSTMAKGSPLALEGAKMSSKPAISSVSDTDGVVCYTEVGSGNNLDWGKCVDVEAVPTSTKTTTPHTTTQTSSNTVTSSSATTTTETSSSTPHTTTVTSTSTETASTVTGTEVSVTTATATATTATGQETESSGCGRGAAAVGALVTSILAAVTA